MATDPFFPLAVRQKIARKIAKRRKELGLSYRAMSFSTGLSLGTLQNYMRDSTDSDMTISALYAIASVLGLHDWGDLLPRPLDFERLRVGLESDRNVVSRLAALSEIENAGEDLEAEVDAFFGFPRTLFEEPS